MSDLVERLRRRAEIMGAMSDPLIDISKTFILEARLTLEQGAVDNNDAADRITALEKDNAELRKVLDETAEILNLMDSEGVRAAAFNNVPEDGLIRELCEQIGYGAVMDSAARQWFKKDSVGAITTGTCAGTLRNLKETVRRARLASTERSGE